MEATMNSFFTRTLLFFIIQHAYLFWHVYRLLGKKRTAWLALPWFVLMGLSPLVFLSLPPDGQMQELFRAMSRVWQGFAYFFLLACLVFDALRAGMWGSGAVGRAFGRQKAATPRTPAKKRLAYVAIALGALVFAYGVHESSTTRFVALQVETPKLPANVERMRIVFVSDLHISHRFGGNHLERVVDGILAQKPDCILLGGDIFDDAMQGTPQDFAQLGRLRAPLGTFAVLGNHDAFGDASRPAAALEQAGITVLSAQRVAAGPVDIIGVDDPEVSAQKTRPTHDPMPLLKTQDPARFAIVLDHRPALRPESVGLFDLQLSGHTHGGQMIFLEPLLRWAYGTPTGFSSHAAAQGTSYLYTSTGLGISKMPIRLLMPPECAVIDIAKVNPVAAQ